MGDIARKADRGSNFYRTGEIRKSFSGVPPISADNAI